MTPIAHLWLQTALRCQIKAQLKSGLCCSWSDTNCSSQAADSCRERELPAPTILPQLVLLAQLKLKPGLCLCEEWNVTAIAHLRLKTGFRENCLPWWQFSPNSACCMLIGLSLTLPNLACTQIKAQLKPGLCCIWSVTPIAHLRPQTVVGERTHDPAEGVTDHSLIWS